MVCLLVLSAVLSGSAPGAALPVAAVALETPQDAAAWLAPGLPAPRRVRNDLLMLPGGISLDEVARSIDRLVRGGDVLTLRNGELAVGSQVVQRGSLDLLPGSVLRLRLVNRAAKVEFQMPLE